MGCFKVHGERNLTPAIIPYLPFAGEKNLSTPFLPACTHTAQMSRSASGAVFSRHHGKCLLCSEDISFP